MKKGSKGRKRRKGTVREREGEVITMRRKAGIKRGSRRRRIKKTEKERKARGVRGEGSSGRRERSRA